MAERTKSSVHVRGGGGGGVLVVVVVVAVGSVVVVGEEEEEDVVVVELELEVDGLWNPAKEEGVDVLRDVMDCISSAAAAILRRERTRFFVFAKSFPSLSLSAA